MAKALFHTTLTPLRTILLIILFPIFALTFLFDVLWTLLTHQGGSCTMCDLTEVIQKGIFTKLLYNTLP